MLTIAVALVFLVLLALDWWRGSRLARVAAVALALITLYFAQPAPWRAARRALDAPESERVTTWTANDARRLPDYQVGVLTMHRMMVDDIMIGIEARGVALGALVWLSISPTFRGARLRAAREAATAEPAPIATTDA